MRGSILSFATAVPATPVITWNNPADITYGTALSSAQLNATANTPGTFTYNPAAGTVLNAGSGQTLSVNFTPTDTTNFTNASKSVTINVLKANQTITFGALSNKTYGDAPFNVSASASSGLTVSLSILSGPATISSNTVTITGAGTATVRASQAGNSNYQAASNVDQSFTVNKATASITLSNLSQTFDGNPKLATATTNPTGLQVIIAYSQNGAPVTSPINAGSYNVSATINEANYQGSATGTLVINNKATPTITWSNPADIIYGTSLSATQLNATANVPGTFVYSPSAGTVLNAGNNQTLAVNFTPTDTTTYNTASQNVSINVLKATPVMTWNTPANITSTTPLSGTQLNATANVPGAFQYMPAAGTVLSAGAYQLSVTFTPTDTANYNSAAKSVQLTVDPLALPVAQLSAAIYSVNKHSSTGQSFATIIVNRTGDLSGASTVKYATLDATDVNFKCDPNTVGQVKGMASRKCDYHLTVGRLRFAAGESSKPILISIVDNAYAKGPLTFTLTLSNPTGATLGVNTTATITILDNGIGGASPIDGTSFYVRQLYVDLLSREPDPAGWAGWITRIDQCGQPGQPPPPCDRVTVGGDGFLRSAEFFDRQFFVLRLYRTGFGRIPQYSEVGDLAYVSGFLSAADLELNKQELVTEIMSRTEFSNKYNGLTDAGFVDALLQTAVVSVPQAVRDGWVTALGNNSKTRAQVYREISERQEVSDKYLHEAQVISAYYGFFTRNPDAAYFNFLQRLDSGEINLGDLAFAFIDALEYRQRFGP